MKISTRLALGFGFTVLMALLIAIFAAINMGRISKELDEVAHNRMVKIEQFTQLKDNLNSIGRYARNILISTDPAFEQEEKSKMQKLRSENSDILAALEKSIVLPDAKRFLSIILDNRKSYNQDIDTVIAMHSSGAKEDANKLLLGSVRAKQNTIFQAVDDSTHFQEKLAKDMAEEAESLAHFSTTVMIALAAFVGVIGAATTWLLVRNLQQALGAEPQDLAEAARRVASGNLMPVEGADRAPAESVLAALGGMQENLANIVGQVRSSSDSIASGSSQIASGNADLSYRTEEQAGNVQQTATAMEQLSGTVKTTADTALQANKMATHASSAAQKGGEMVSHVVQTMQDIAASSRKISDIIGVIDGIAFQTNILALNAAVEAARAGEQGRGFAVVASEVRNLASRSAGAAKEIKTLISASVEKVDIGARQVNDAGDSMGEIVSQVQRVSQMISEISNATNEQALGISQLGEAVVQLDQVTQQNAALVEESAAAAESLESQAASLADLVSVFKLDGQVGVPASSARKVGQATIRKMQATSKVAVRATGGSMSSHHKTTA